MDYNMMHSLLNKNLFLKNKVHELEINLNKTNKIITSTYKLLDNTDIIIDQKDNIINKQDNIINEQDKILQKENKELNRTINRLETKLNKLQKEFNDYKELKEHEFNDYKELKDNEIDNIKKLHILNNRYSDIMDFIRFFISDINYCLNQYLKHFDIFKDIIKKRNQDCHTFNKNLYKNDNDYRNYANYKFITYLKNINNDIKFLINIESPNTYDKLLEKLIKTIKYDDSISIIPSDEIDQLFNEYI